MTRNQLRTSEYRPEEDSIYTGLDITGIRKLPAVRSQVEDLIVSVQKDAPSLDRRPDFNLGKPLPAPRSKIVLDSDDDEPPVEQGYVYQRRSDGTLRRVKLVQQTVSSRRSEQFSASGTTRNRLGDKKTSVVDDLDNDSEASSDEDFDENPRPGYSFSWRRDAKGEMYNREVAVSETPSFYGLQVCP